MKRFSQEPRKVCPCCSPPSRSLTECSFGLQNGSGSVCGDLLFVASAQSECLLQIEVSHLCPLLVSTGIAPTAPAVPGDLTPSYSYACKQNSNEHRIKINYFFKGDWCTELPLRVRTHPGSAVMGRPMFSEPVADPLQELACTR